MNFKNKYMQLILPVGICILLYFAFLRLDMVLSVLSNLILILRPFLFGGVIAYLLAPLCGWAEHRILKLTAVGKEPTEKHQKSAKGISILIVILLTFLLNYLFMALVIPQLISSLTLLAAALPEELDKFYIWLDNTLANQPDLRTTIESYTDNLSFDTSTFISDTALPYLTTILGGMSQTMGVVKDMLIGLFAAIYLLLERKNFSRQSAMLIRAAFRRKAVRDDGQIVTQGDLILEEAGVLNGYLTGFIKGKLIDSLIIGIICGICTTLMGIPYAVLVSVIVGVTNIIPFFGPFFGAIPSALLILMVNPTKCLIFVIFVVILQQFDGNVLGPKILGDATSLNSFWILFSIILFGGMMGVPGMIIGVPVFGFLYHLLRKWVHKRLDGTATPKTE